MKPKVLVTGASGFLGRNLADRLRAVGSYELLLTGGHEDIALGITKLDLTEPADTEAKIARFAPDVVCHIGALVDLSRNFDVARKTADINIVGTINLLRALTPHKPRKFIFASTEEVYGEGEVPYKEQGNVMPPSPYAATKLTCEHLMRLYAGEAFNQGYALRIGTMYGPYLPSHRLIAQIIGKALRGDEIPLTSGTKKRDYVFVGDIVDAILSAIERKNTFSYEIINLGGGVAITLRQLAEAVIRLTASRSILRLGTIPDRIGESDEWLLDNGKAADMLGWEPKTKLEDGLKKTIAFYKTHNVAYER